MMIHQTSTPKFKPNLTLCALCIATIISVVLAFKYSQIVSDGLGHTCEACKSDGQPKTRAGTDALQVNQSTEWAHDEETEVINPILESSAANKLPIISSSYNPNDFNLLKACEDYFFNPDSLDGQRSIGEYGHTALAAKTQSMVYSEAFAHKYDTFTDLKLAAGPEVDQEKCLRQLEHLIERTRIMHESKYRSKDISLFQLLDTFGHKSSGMFVGNGFFEGMYNECLRLSIKLPEGQTSKTRYCVVSTKHKDWPQMDKHDVLKLKMGVCLPSACDSLNYKNKYDMIFRLSMSQMRHMEQGQIKLSSVYCLPDEQSPLRSILSSRSATLTLAAVLGWLSLLAFATYKHASLSASSSSLVLKNAHGASATEQPNGRDTPERRMRARAAWAAARRESGFGLSNGMSLDPRDDETTEESSSPSSSALWNSASVKLFSLLSVTNNLRLLFDTSKESSLMEIDKKQRDVKPEDSRRRDSIDAQRTQSGAPQTTAQQPKIVNLSCIEGIKVISMCYVIMGHVLMCLTSVINNGREMNTVASFSFYLANLVPAFAVNSFFVITGILTAYLMLKQDQSHSFVTSPTKWIAFIVYRYLRIMPMYALVVLYTKTLAKYTGSGPLWDYATSSLAQRRACEQESWSWTLLFGSNFLPPLEHCIPAGWYLSNDFQFFMVTPFFLALLHGRPNLGRSVIKLCIVAGYFAGFWSIFSKHDIDVRPIAKFAPNGFKTYISQFSFNYTQPQYRIPAYLIGILIGHSLFRFERDKLKFFAQKQQSIDDKSTKDDQKELVEPDWSEQFKKFAVPVSSILVAACCITPAIGARLYFNKTLARFMVAFITPSYHVVFASAIGCYIMLATTGNGSKLLNDFLSAPAWKPFARLSLCAVLINVEVINYIIQTNSNLHYLTNQYQFAINLICILATYLVSVVVCVLFEAPMRALLNTILLAMTKFVAARKKVGPNATKKLE